MAQVSNPSLGSGADEKHPPVQEEPAETVNAPKHTTISTTGAPAFKLSSTWQRPVLNPLNLKSYTVPFFNLRSAYGRTLHLSWLGFFVAFLSWFAFPPLFPEAIKKDLKLTTAQVGNSNIIALLATLIVRVVVGPAVDRFGPRKVMASILVLGAIPSGLAGTAHSAGGLYAIRFFIGILGGTFVPCVAWTTAFFDRSCVGTVAAIAAGLGNAGGGATYAIMVSLYSKLHESMSQHVAWRVAFAVVPVPVLLTVAALTLIFGQDHPAGKWSQRHLTPATAAAIKAGYEVTLDHDEIRRMQEKKQEPESATEEVREVTGDEDEEPVRAPTTERQANPSTIVELDVMVNEPLTVKSALKILADPVTWLPALAYMTTFGFELAVDSNLAANILTPHPTLSQLNAGYLASVYGLLNIITRPLGGLVADMLYARFGIRSKKYFTLGLGIVQGALSLGFGKLLQSEKSPNLGHMMGLLVVLAIVNEMANGANFSLVPHVHPSNNGVISGLVGSFGNLGGIFYALMWRFKPHQGTPWVYAGCFALIVNVLLIGIRSPKS